MIKVYFGLFFCVFLFYDERYGSIFDQKVMPGLDLGSCTRLSASHKKAITRHCKKALFPDYLQNTLINLQALLVCNKKALLNILYEVRVFFKQFYSMYMVYKKVQSKLCLKQIMHLYFYCYNAHIFF